MDDDQLATPVAAPDSIDDMTDIAMGILSQGDGTSTEVPSGTQVDEPAGQPAEGSKTEGGEPEQQVQETPKFRVKVRGEEQEVELPELLNGYSRTEDYKAKTAEVAEQRRQIEAQAQSIQAERQRYVDAANQALTFMQTADPVLSEGIRTDWAKLAQEDPTAYVQKQAQFQQRLQQAQAIEAQRNQVIAMQTQETLRSEDDRLAQAIPEWRDEAGRQKITESVTKTMKSLGFSDQEIGGFTDHRIVIAAMKIAKYDEMVAAQASLQAKKAAPSAQKVLKPEASQAGQKSANPGVKALKQQARMSGRDDDAVAAAMAILGES